MHGEIPTSIASHKNILYIYSLEKVEKTGREKNKRGREGGGMYISSFSVMLEKRSKTEQMTCSHAKCKQPFSLYAPFGFRMHESDITITIVRHNTTECDVCIRGFYGAFAKLSTIIISTLCFSSTTIYSRQTSLTVRFLNKKKKKIEHFGLFICTGNVNTCNFQWHGNTF